jgi:hypothetical protein
MERNPLLKLYQALAGVSRKFGKIMRMKWLRVAVAFTAVAFAAY